MCTPEDKSSGTIDTVDAQKQALRERAEIAYRAIHSNSPLTSEATIDQMRVVLHELRVHEIELEMQNEELRRTQLELDSSRSKYFDLYDLAPVGYCTLGNSGLIEEANIMTAELLGVKRHALVNQPLSHFILRADQDIFYKLKNRLFHSGQSQQCELRVRRPSGELIWMQVTAILANGGEQPERIIRIVLVDISSLKQAESNLLKSQQFSLSILNSLQDHIAVLDENGVIIALNDAWINFSQRNSQHGIPKYGLGENYFSICLKAASESQQNLGASEFCAGMQKVLSGAADHFQVDYPCYSPVSKAWYRASVIRMHSDVKGLIVSHCDITQSKQLEIALQESRRELLLITDKIPGPVGRVDHHLCFANVNAYFEELTGQSRDSLLGKSLTEVFQERTVEKILPYTNRVLKGEAVTFECPISKVRHETIYSLVHLVPDYSANGEVIGFFLVGIDITDRRRAQAAQAEAHDRLEKIASRLPGVVYQLRLRADGTACFPYASDRMRDMFHVAPSEVLDDATPIFNICHADDRALLVDSIKQSALQLTPFSHEFRILLEDGTERILQSNALPERESAGSTLWHGFLTDITDLKRAQAVQASLELQLRESQKMEAIGTLAGGIAHDFNNMLSIILNNADLARVECSTSNARTADFIEEIQKAGKRAKGLVQQILSFSRKQTSERAITALGPIVEESASLLRATLPARISLITFCDPSAPPVLADGTQMEQVILNLATNAMQSIKQGSGTIEIRLESLTMDHETIESNAQLRELAKNFSNGIVRLEVSDTGQGMEPPTIKRIFEPFYTTKPVGEGTGLGLSVVHGIVQSHEGVITVNSQPGKGTTFSVYLPAAAEQTSTAVVAKPSLPNRDTSFHAKILYLDDDIAVLRSVSMLLKMLGFDVVGFSNQKEALDAIQMNPLQFDVVVTDYHMPGKSGLEIACEIQRIRKDLPIAITSGFIDDDLRSKAAAVGVRELISKPIIWQQFKEIIHNMVQ